MTEHKKTNLAMSNGFPCEIDLFRGEVAPRKCQCGRPGCDLTLEGFRSDCRIHPSHRAWYNQKLKDRRRDKRIDDAHVKAESFHEDSPWLMDELVIEARQYEKFDVEVPFGLIWKPVCWRFRTFRKVKINNNWESWYRDEVEKKVDVTFRRKRGCDG